MMAAQIGERKNRSNTRPNSSFISVRAINLTIQSTNGCFLKRFHHDGPRLFTAAVPRENSNVTALAVTRCLRARASHFTRMAGQKGVSVFLEAKVTEGVSIDDYSTYRATRFSEAG